MVMGYGAVMAQSQRESSKSTALFLLSFLYFNDSATLDSDIVSMVFHYDLPTDHINHRKPPKPIMTHGSTCFKLRELCASFYTIVCTFEINK